RLLRVEYHLDPPVTVAQVQEDDAAVVAPAVDPPLQETRLSGVGHAQLTAGVSAAHRWASRRSGWRAAVATRDSRRSNYTDCTGEYRRRGDRAAPGGLRPDPTAVRDQAACTRHPPALCYPPYSDHSAPRA